MKKIKYLVITLLSGACLMKNANAKNVEERIRSIFDINSAYCAIITNGATGIDNRDSAFEGRGYGTASSNAMLLMENGVNEITVEMGALGWFSKEKKDNESYKKFSPDAYCSLDLTLFEGANKKSIGKIDIGINSDGLPYDKNNDKDVTVTRVAAPKVIKGHIPDEYFDEGYYPEEMELYRFTKKIILKGLPEWKWTNATEFTSTPLQVNVLKNAYMELWQIFAKKNNAGLKHLMKESTYAWSVTTGSTADDIYNNEQFVADLHEPSLEMIPINWSDYKIIVFNKGRMVRYVNKSMPELSPVSYYITDSEGNKGMFSFAPIFSIVDGKITPVI